MIDDPMNAKSLGRAVQNAYRFKEELEKAQGDISTLTVVGEAGGGMVKITITGERRAQHVHIDPSLLADGGMLQDLLTSAITDAMQKAEKAISEKLQSSLSRSLSEDS